MTDNLEMRDLINQVCEVLALQVQQKAPRCTRITRRQGHSYWWKGTFSIPVWVLKAHPAYRTYYIIHEATHVFARHSGHGPLFLELEKTLLRTHGLDIDRGRGVYAKTLRRASDGKPLCDEYGRKL